MSSTIQNRNLTSMPGLLIASLTAAPMAVCSFLFHTPSELAIQRGLCLPSPNLWQLSPLTSWTINTALIALCATMLILTNKHFSIVKGTTTLFASTFLLLSCSVPMLSARLCSSTIVAAAVIACTTILFNQYNRRNAADGVFNLFTLLSIGSMIQYSFILLMPIFMIGLMHMKVFRFKEAAAMLLGIVTPYWIALGFGIIDFSSFSMPTLTNLFYNFNASYLWLLIAVGLTVIGTGVLTVLNMMKVMATNGQVRAYNSFINLLGFSLLWYMLFDYTNMLTYLTSFNIAAGLQTAHIFENKRLYYGTKVYTAIACVYIILFILIIYG